MPLYAFPTADVRTDLLRKTERPAPRCHAGATVFHNESVDITVDGERQQRPITIFSTPAR